MSLFRKKPVVIDAWHFDRTNQEPRPFWVERDWLSYDGHTLLIPTREGTMRASDGDWIIRGVANEVYPCKPDIFAATYEAV